MEAYQCDSCAELFEGEPTFVVRQFKYDPRRTEVCTYDLCEGCMPEIVTYGVDENE